MNDFMLFGGFVDRRTDRQTDIGGCRVAFATEKRRPGPSNLLQVACDGASYNQKQLNDY